jgi:hypothetical protein
MAFRQFTPDDREALRVSEEAEDARERAVRTDRIRRRANTIDALLLVSSSIAPEDQRPLAALAYLRDTYDTDGVASGRLAQLSPEQASLLVGMQTRYLAPRPLARANTSPAHLRTDIEIAGVFVGDLVDDGTYAEEISAGRSVIRQIRADGHAHRIGEVMGRQGRYVALRMSGEQVAVHPTLEAAAAALCTPRRASLEHPHQALKASESETHFAVALAIAHVRHLVIRYDISLTDEEVPILMAESATLLGISWNAGGFEQGFACDRRARRLYEIDPKDGTSHGHAASEP